MLNKTSERATAPGTSTGTPDESAHSQLILKGDAVPHTEPAPALVTDLTGKQEAFAQLYVDSGNAAEAYRFAYDVADSTAAATVRNNGYKTLAHPKVQARIRALRAELCARSLMSKEELIADLEAMANADINELMALTVVGCRHCHGEAHGYQWRDEAELARAVDAYMAALGTPKPLPLPDMAGGFGYKPDRAPNPDCPRCDGAGVTVVRLSNTADVSPGARKLYRGIELYQDGTVRKVLLNDPLAARIELHRVKGMHIDRSINLNATISVPALKDVSTDEALAILESFK